MILRWGLVGVLEAPRGRDGRSEIRLRLSAGRYKSFMYAAMSSMSCSVRSVPATLKTLS